MPRKPSEAGRGVVHVGGLGGGTHEDGDVGSGAGLSPHIGCAASAPSRARTGAAPSAASGRLASEARSAAGAKA